MNFKRLIATCRLCGKRLELSYDPSCAIERVVGLSLIVVCNHCYDQSRHPKPNPTVKQGAGIPERKFL